MSESPRYKDYSTQKMQQLEEDALEALDKEGEIWNYKLIQNHLEKDDYDWSESTMERALVELRKKLKNEDKIKVVKESGKSIGQKKKWRLNK